MKENISRKYLGVLTLIAIAILYLGLRFGPEKKTDSVTVSATASAILEQRVRQDQATELGRYLASRAKELAEHVIFLPERGASGVLYSDFTQALTSGGTLIDPALILEHTLSSGFPAPIATTGGQENWTLTVARSSENQPLWIASLRGATTASQCNGVEFQELALNATLDASFTGAGIFNLDGSLAGIAVPCDGSLRAVSVSSIASLLAASSSAERLFSEKFGFRAIPRTDDANGGGFMVTDVWAETWADRTGLRPGDVIQSDAEALTEEVLSQDLRILRPGQRGSVRLKPGSTGTTAGVTLLPDTSKLTALVVNAGSRAARAGLRSGDRFVSVYGTDGAVSSDPQRLLNAAPAEQIWVVYQRGRKRGVVELPHE